MIKHQNWWQLSSIQIGGAICLPVIIIGQALYQTYGFTSAVVSILIGNFILLLLGLVSAKMSYEKRKTTPENAVEYFGEKGVSFFALTMSLSLLGWFAIQLNMMSLSVLDLLSLDTSLTATIVFNLILGALITAAALYGIKAINLLADFSLPLLIGTLTYALFTTDQPLHPSSSFLSFGGVSMVIAMNVAVVIDLPTYFRHAKSAKDGYISMGIIFGLALPLLEILGVYLAATSSGGSILDVLKRSNGPLWNIWVALFLVLAAWTTNNLNLYSGVVCLESILKAWSDKKRTLLFGGIGTIISCFNLLNHLELVLDVMGIFIVSMGTVIITRYLILQFNRMEITQQDYRQHFVAWLVGITLGFLSMKGLGLTSIPVLDATIGSSLGTSLILFRKGRHEKAYTG